MTALYAELPALPAMYFDPTTAVFFDPAIHSWNVFSHRDVSTVLSDAVTFSSGYGMNDEDRLQANPMLAGLWAADGKRHDDLKGPVARSFRAKVLEQLGDDVRAIVTGLIDGVLASGDGHVEIVSALTEPLPCQMICRLLGLDTRYGELMRQWTYEVAEVAVSTNTAPPQPQVADFFRDMVASRRATPGSSLADDLIAAYDVGHLVDGKPMTEWDLIGYFAMMLNAGTDTSACGAGNALLFLTEYGHWAELTEHPDLIPGAVDETLRWYPPFEGVRRVVARDTELGGHHIAAGEWVTAWVSAANRDPEHFPEPGVFDIRRRPNQYLTFGLGPHYCMGGPLARLEIRILVEEAVRRLPGLRRDHDRPIARRNWIVDGLTEAHFTYDIEVPLKARGHAD